MVQRHPKVTGLTDGKLQMGVNQDLITDCITVLPTFPKSSSPLPFQPFHSRLNLVTGGNSIPPPPQPVSPGPFISLLPHPTSLPTRLCLQIISRPILPLEPCSIPHGMFSAFSLSSLLFYHITSLVTQQNQYCGHCLHCIPSLSSTPQMHSTR